MLTNGTSVAADAFSLDERRVPRSGRLCEADAVRACLASRTLGPVGRFRVALIGTALVVLLVACTASSDEAVPRESTVRTPNSITTASVPGGLVAGRLIMVGGPSWADPQPTAGTVEAILDTDTSHAAKAVGSADDAGRFEMSLPPGVYSLSGRSPRFTDGRESCASHGPVTVENGGRIDVDVFCERH